MVTYPSRRCFCCLHAEPQTSLWAPAKPAAAVEGAEGGAGPGEAEGVGRRGAAGEPVGAVGSAVASR